MGQDPQKIPTKSPRNPHPQKIPTKSPRNPHVALAIGPSAPHLAPNPQEIPKKSPRNPHVRRLTRGESPRNPHKIPTGIPTKSPSNPHQMTTVFPKACCCACAGHFVMLLCCPWFTCVVMSRALGHKVMRRTDCQKPLQISAPWAAKVQECTTRFPIRDVVTFRRSPAAKGQECTTGFAGVHFRRCAWPEVPGGASEDIRNRVPGDGSGNMKIMFAEMLSGT